MRGHQFKNACKALWKVWLGGYGCFPLSFMTASTNPSPSAELRYTRICFYFACCIFFCIICLRQKYTQAMQTKKGLNQQCAHNPLIDVQKEVLSDEPPKATSLQQCEHMLRYLKSFHSSVLAWLVSTIWMGFADIFFSATEATATLNLKGWYISSGIWLCEILLDMSFIARIWRYVYLRFKNCEKVEESISFCGISLVFDL